MTRILVTGGSGVLADGSVTYADFLSLHVGLATRTARYGQLR
jgi:hypothetical protein